MEPTLVLVGIAMGGIAASARGHGRVQHVSYNAASNTSP